MNKKLWCADNGCMYYNCKSNKCTRVGKQGENKGKQGVCWMNKTEGEY